MFDSVPAAFDEVADQYDQAAPRFTAPVAAHLVGLVNLCPGEKVLDAGCGTGKVTELAARQIGPDGHVTGIDLSARMLERAAANIENAGLSDLVTFRPGDAARPHAEPGSFDAVLSSLVLYLLPDPMAALAAWHDVLAEGGTLAFSWSVRQAPDWLHVLGAIEKYNKKPTFLSFTDRLPRPGGMQHALHKAGYQHITITTETITTVYESPKHFWKQAVSQGMWVAWRNIPAADLEHARGDAMRLLEPMCGSDGTLTRSTEIAYAIAHKAARRDNGTHVI